LTVEIRATPLANKIIESLSKRARTAYGQFKADLAARGCAAPADWTQFRSRTCSLQPGDGNDSGSPHTNHLDSDYLSRNN
jgi:hypothetical protein